MYIPICHFSLRKVLFIKYSFQDSIQSRITVRDKLYFQEISEVISSKYIATNEDNLEKNKYF